MRDPGNKRASLPAVLPGVAAASGASPPAAKSIARCEPALRMLGTLACRLDQASDNAYAKHTVAALYPIAGGALGGMKVRFADLAAAASLSCSGGRVCRGHKCAMLALSRSRPHTPEQRAQRLSAL